MVEGNHSIFFKIERKSVVAQALRISKFDLKLYPKIFGNILI